MKIKVMAKRDYGRVLYYPADEKTKTFIKIVRRDQKGNPAFRKADIELLKSLDFEIEIVPFTDLS